jgi:hypothetical protein
LLLIIEIGSRRSIIASPASDPLFVKLVNGRWINVGGRGNGTDAAVPHIGEQEGFAADKNVEPGFGERVEKSLGVIPIARATPDDKRALSSEQLDLCDRPVFEK